MLTCAGVPDAAVQACCTGWKPFAVTVTSPEFEGTLSNVNAPETSVEVSAEYAPALSFTCAPMTEAPLESRTTPVIRVRCANAGSTNARPTTIKSTSKRLVPKMDRNGRFSTEYMAGHCSLTAN